MRVFSYIVARDFGFAPNPFHGFCSLADCKPVIRRVAQVGDLVIGTGGAGKGLAGGLVFAMRVSEKLTFQEFWQDPRFEGKKPNFLSGTKDAYGDNIYEPNPDGSFTQHHSHHSLAGGATNLFNRNKDTSTNSILISDDFVYWGAAGPLVPDALRNYHGWDLCAPTQGHVSRFPLGFIELIHEWFDGTSERGVWGSPGDWT